MPKLYNPSNGPVIVSLTDGTTATFPPKQWVTVADAQLQSPSVVRALTKQQLIRQEDPTPDPEEPAPQGGKGEPTPSPASLGTTDCRYHIKLAMPVDCC